MNSKTGKFTELPNGLRVHYQEAGHGATAVLLVPGWTMTTSVFIRQLEYFEASEKYRIIALDSRSHGKTMNTPDGNNYEQHGRDLAEFINQLQLESIVLCGWSFGTLAALSYIDQFGPDRLSGLIMLDGPPRSVAPDKDNFWATYTYDDADGMEEFFTMGKLRDPERTNIEFARWMLEDKENQCAVDWLVAMTRKTPNESASQLNATAHFLNFEQTLIRFDVNYPVWCVLREERQKTVFEWCAKNIPNAVLSAFGGHMMFWEQSDRFNKLMERFLDAEVH